MARFLKYRIPNSEWGIAQLAISNIKCDVSIVDLDGGFTEVDILWEEEPLSELDAFKVFPSGVGKHTFLGMESLYEQEYNNQ